MTEEKAESKVLRALNRAMKEGRRTPRRHMIVALLFVLPALAAIILFFVWLLSLIRP